MSKRRRANKRKRATSEARSARDWPRLLAEATLILLVLVVPLVINPFSKNLLDVKDLSLEIGVALGLSAWLVASLARGRMEWASCRLNVAVAAFAIWAGMSIFYSDYRYATVSEGGRLAAHIGLYWLVILAIRDMRQVRRLLGVTAVGGLLVCVYAFVQRAGADPVPWHQGGARVFSFLGNPTYLAGYLVLLIPLMIAVGLPPSEGREAQGGRWRGRMSSVFFLLVAGLMLLSLYLTVSLSPIIGLGLGAALALALVIARHWGNFRGVHVVAFLVAGIFAAGLFLGVYLHLPKSQQRRITKVLHLKDPYGKERSMIRQAGVDLFRQHPVFGTGYGTYRIYALERLAPGWYEDLGKSTRKMLVPNYAHNEYIQVLAGTGVIGGAIFFAMLGLAYWVGLRAALRHASPDWARLGAAVVAGMSAFLLQNFFGVTFRQPGTVTFFWLSLGFLTVAGAGVGAADGEQAADPRVRQWHCRKLSVGAVASVAVVLACVVLLLGSVLLGQVRAGVLVKRADSAAKRGRFDTAGMLAGQAIKADPYSVFAYYVGAYAWGSLGDHEKSLEANKKALSLLPGNASVYYNIGVNYKELGRFEEARESFERAIELMPTADRHYAAMAELLLEEGKMEEALSYAREAIRLRPKDSRLYLLAADISSRQQKLDETLEFMRQAAAVAPKDGDVWRQYAQLLVRRKQYDEAIRASKWWIEIEPDSALAYNLLGTSYYDTKKFAGARKAFLKALQIDPTHGEARLNLAYTYAQLRNPDAMFRELSYLAETEPNTRAGRLARQTLERGRRGIAR